MSAVGDAAGPADPGSMDLGGVLRRLRRGRGLAQRDLLQPLHLGSHSAIVDYESGRRIPPEAVVRDYERLFGLEPGTLVRMREQALAARAAAEARSAEQARDDTGSAAGTTTGLAGVSGADPLALPRPRQLPPAAEHFTGRTGELTRLDRLLREREGTAPVVISAVSGMGGIGKTTLAVYWAHQARDSFLDGDLYIDLQGFHPSGRPVAPEDAVGRFLTALGVAEDRMPATLDERTALYRTLMADRSMLVLLDNARDADQVRPLLPASDWCRVLITSRSRLSGLAVREGAQRISLDILSLRESVQLLRRAIGPRAAEEPGATAALAELCGLHPLALRIAAERIATDWSASVRDAVEELERSPRLGALAVDDDESTAVRAVFSWSYQTLPAPTRRLFRLLGLHDGPDLPLAACAALAGLGNAETRLLLGQLVDAHLVEQPAHDRYGVHDLLRLFAHERALDEETEEGRTEAAFRIGSWYLHSACAARVALDPHLPPMEPSPAKLPVEPMSFDDDADALAWCETERANFTATALTAAAYELHEIGWKLPTALFPFFDLRRHYGDWITTHKSAAASAHAAGDPEAEGKVLCNLGSAYRPMRRFGEAVENYERALALFGEAGWRMGEGKALGNLAATHADAGDNEKAITVGQAALAVFEELGDEYGQALCLSNLGNSYVRRARNEDAVAAQARARILFDHLGDQRGIGRTLAGTGSALAGLGRFEEALDSLTAAVDAFVAVADQHEQATALADTADVYAALGRRDEADRAVRRAAEMFQALGEHWMVAEIRARLRP